MKLLKYALTGRKYIFLSLPFPSYLNSLSFFLAILKHQVPCLYSFPRVSLLFTPALLEMFFLMHSGITLAHIKWWLIFIPWSAQVSNSFFSGPFCLFSLMEYWASRSCICQTLNTRPCNFIFWFQFHANFNCTVTKVAWFSLYEILTLFSLNSASKSGIIRNVHF